MITQTGKRKSIPLKPRKNRSIRKAREFIYNSNICWLPVDPFKLYDEYGWLIMAWGKAREALGIEDPLCLKKTRAEARTSIPRGTNIVLTVYDEEVKPYTRIRWTIAHEIGHIILGHLGDFEKTAINRGGLQKKEYDVLESEADFFAAELLQPMAIIRAVGALEAMEIAHVCDVSRAAAANRATDIAWWGHKKIATEADSPLKEQFNLYLTVVSVCANSPNLPSISSILKNNPEVAKMIKKHAYIKTDVNNRFLQCPICGNVSFSTQAKYCKMCGLYLYNGCSNGATYTCLDNNCGEINPGDARFCELCGSKTQLMQKGLLMSWEEIIQVYQEVAAGMDPEEDKNSSYPVLKG